MTHTTTTRRTARAEWTKLRNAIIAVFAAGTAYTRTRSSAHTWPGRLPGPRLRKLDAS